MKRTRLSDRVLPNYSRGEETMNTLTHIIGGCLGIVALLLCLSRAYAHRNVWGMVSGAVYGLCMTALYTISSTYHGLRPGTAKKVLQVLDHCTIYFLIAGSYTPIVLSALRPVYPKIAWGLLFFQWILAIVATMLTAIDLKKYKVFSMACYIGMGWAVLPFLKQTQEVLTLPGFLFLLFGGIAYTIGAILYGIGSKRKWFHSIFHIFVLLGSLLQFFSIWLYAL